MDTLHEDLHAEVALKSCQGVPNQTSARHPVYATKVVGIPHVINQTRPDHTCTRLSVPHTPTT
jgi:hypothetical protein